MNTIMSGEDDITLISLWSEDNKEGQLYSGKPFIAKNVIKRSISDVNDDLTTFKAID